MDYSDMNLGSWSSYLTRFKNLVRPTGVDAVGEREENVEAARSQESAAMALSAIATALPDLVFEGYRDWYTGVDEWVLRNLGQMLTADEEHQILLRLDQGTPEALAELLHYIADERLGAWQNVAREEFARVTDDVTAGTLVGVANTANWQASRTPGTYYYTYTDGRYLYSDLADAPANEWETLPVRDRLAAANSSPWGQSGWYATPVGDPDLYGGSFVFAADPDGPWLTEEQARAELQEPAADDIAEEDVESAMRAMLRAHPEYADIDEEDRRQVVIETIREVLAEREEAI